MAIKTNRADSRQAVLDRVSSQLGHFRSVYRLQSIALIGSFAREEQTPESDVDFLVDLEEGTPNIHLVKGRLREELQSQLGRPVDLASERYLKPYYKEQILREAIYVQ